MTGARQIAYQFVFHNAMPLHNLHHLWHLDLRVPLREFVVVNVWKFVVVN